MPAFRLLAKLMLYYAMLAAVLLVVLWLDPALQSDLPIGRVQALLGQADGAPMDGIAELAKAKGPSGRMPPFLASLVWLAAAMIGSLLAAYPVSKVYMNIRANEDYDQSLVDTIVVLPLVVTSIVVIVQHSLALAFSLAGIAGAVRYRNTLKSSGDLLFILLSIGIGLAAGIGAVELAVLSSAAFNVCFVMLWYTNYGERGAMKRFLGEFDRGNGNGNAAAQKGPADETEIASPSLDRQMKRSDWMGL